MEECIMVTEEIKAEARSFGFHTGEYVALKHIYQNREQDARITERGFLSVVSEMLGASQEREA
jgi:hypothetical protein